MTDEASANSAIINQVVEPTVPAERRPDRQAHRLEDGLAAGHAEVAEPSSVRSGTHVIVRFTDVPPRPVVFTASSERLAGWVAAALAIRLRSARMRAWRRRRHGPSSLGADGARRTRDDDRAVPAAERVTAVLERGAHLVVPGTLAVIIGAVGTAGVLAFSVGARTNVIGIRTTLAPTCCTVQRMILAGRWRTGGDRLGAWRDRRASSRPGSCEGCCSALPRTTRARSSLGMP